MTTTPANAEQLADAVYDALSVDAKDYFETPDGVYVIAINGWSLRICDDGDDQAPNGISWWVDSPEERGSVSDGWEILSIDQVVTEATILARDIERYSSSTSHPVDYSGQRYSIGNGVGWIKVTWNDNGSTLTVPAYRHANGTVLIPSDCQASVDDYVRNGTAAPGSRWVNIATGDYGVIINGIPALGMFATEEI